MDVEPTRRRFLSLVGATGLGVVLAGCTSKSTTTAPSSTTATSPTASAASTPPPPPSSSPAPTFKDLGQQLGDRLATPGHSSYKPSTLLYNPRFAGQKPPLGIANCSSRSDVVDCVRFAAAGGADLRIRNGGHSYGGWSSGSGLVANLANMNDVTVDHAAMTATVGAGALLGTVYSQLAGAGVSIGAGSCATVGLTGLTLGGGVGLLTRLYGLTCDQVSAFQVVTADGRTRTVGKTDDPDLFWALQGGGGSLVAVTGLTLKVRPAPQLRQVYLEWSGEQAADVVSAWQQWASGVPREVWSTCKILAKPGDGVRATITAVDAGGGSLDSQIATLLKNTPSPRTNAPSSHSYGDAMLASAGCLGESADQCIAAALTPAQRLPEAAASAVVRTPLSDKAIGAIVSAVQAGMDVKNMVEGGVSFDALGGAVSDVDSDATAFPWRDALATVQYTATWPFNDAEQPARYDAFVQSERSALTPELGDSAYLNYADPSLTDYATAYWGPNLARLKTVKKTYDPHGVFDSPQGVPGQ